MNINIQITCHALLILLCGIDESYSGEKATIVGVTIAEVNNQRQACFIMELPGKKQFHLPVSFIKNRHDCFVEVEPKILTQT